MLVNKLAHKMLLNTKIFMRFSGGHHEVVYDWRDDQTKNPDFYQDPRMIGCKSGHEYVTPFVTDQKLTYTYSHPAEYDQKNLTTNFVGSQNFSVIQNYP